MIGPVDAFRRSPRLPDLGPQTWRVPPGDAPLAAGSDGPLRGRTVAVKDLFAVAGHRIGAGNPTWLAAAPTEERHATAVQLLLDAGADIAGIAQTDELAFALMGANVHYGAPCNPAAPDRVTGGSSSGSAAAVASGAADIGLGTDTAGSIRVPASYTGIFGLRTTHGLVATDGLLGLAPSFDSVGLLTPSASTLQDAAQALLPGCATSRVTRVITCPALTASAEPETRVAFHAALSTYADGLGASVTATRLALDLEQCVRAFRVVQQAEAWREHGSFVEAHPDSLAPEIRERFLAGRAITGDTEAQAREVLSAVRSELAAALPPGTVLALPATSGPAPRIGLSAGAVDSVRQSTMRLTCLASLAGSPAVSAPTGGVDGLPVGLSLIAAPGEDLSLVSSLRDHG